jgi:hypothetical protein
MKRKEAMRDVLSLLSRVLNVGIPPRHEVLF